MIMVIYFILMLDVIATKPQPSLSAESAPPFLSSAKVPDATP
jgi:hypothetical protein